jgi:magnesium-transporting ATPase (P-type)
MNEIPPPPNRAIGWYRFMLWVMPTCVAITSAFGLGWLAGHLRSLNDNSLIWIWVVLNIVAAIGIGIFQARLESPNLRRRDGSVRPARVVSFVMLQFIIVPVLSFVVGYGCCLMVSL